MKRIHINQANDSPTVLINGEVGLIRITGRAIAHNPEQEYKELEKVIMEYCLDPCKISSINIQLTGISTNASKWLFHILKEIEKITHPKKQFVINWFYEEYDDFMLEVGEDYQDIIDLPFYLIAA
jgi:hypothetical protein